MLSISKGDIVMGLLSFLSLDFTTNLHSEDTVRESLGLFNKAHKSINIVAGRLNSDFYNDKRTIASLNRAIRKGVSVNVAYAPSKDNDAHRIEFKKRFPKAHVRVAKKTPNRHWVCIDSKHLRIERTHAETATITPAVVCRNASVLASEWEKKFATLV